MAQHDAAAKEWGALGAWDIVSSAITYKPKINSRTVQGEKTGARARQEGGEADGGTDTVGRTVNGASRLVGQPGQVVVPAEARADVSAHSFWKRGTTTMFDIRIVNLDAGSYLHMTLEKALEKAEKEKNDLYLQAFLEHIRNFTPMIYSGGGIPGAEALGAHTRLAVLLSYKLKQEYLEMCGFVPARISLVIVRSNSLLSCVPRDKGARIRQQPELTDGAVTALLAPWSG